MVKGYYKEIVEALKASGCDYVRPAKGSHELWWSPINGRKFTVPKTMSRITANQVFKQAGIDKKM